MIRNAALQFWPAVFLFLCLPVACAAEPLLADQQIHRLIIALGDMDYFVRQKAESELAKIGFTAVDALTDATDSDDLEIAARAGRLLRVIKSNWVQPNDPPGVATQLSDYESQDDATREAKVTALIAMSEHQGVPAVCRVICYDRSLVLAKSAAVQVIQSLAAEAAKPDLAAEIRKRLEGCRRGPAQWVLGWVAASGNPQALAEVGTKIVADEEGLLLRHPSETSPAIIESLLRLEIAALRDAHRGADAADCMQRLLKLHHGEPATLATLLQWLMDQKDWPATKLVEAEYRKTIAGSPDLLYLVAEAQSRRGDQDEAERSAAQALRLNPEVDNQALESHFQVGRSLEDRGRHDWAIREWEYVVRTAPADSGVGTFTAHFLAELYHDIEQDDRAAETLSRLEKTFAARSDQWKLLGGDSDSLTLGSVKARMLFFQACHWRDRGDKRKQREALDAALKTEAYDIEVLIECYRVPDAEADYRAKVRKLIDKRLCELRERIGDNSDDAGTAQPCNEFAWLVANTTGDLGEALKFSKRSLELSGENGSYRDTLARVYYAKGDLDEALKQQTAAAALLPYNHPVQKQLEFLRDKVKHKDDKR